MSNVLVRGSGQVRISMGTWNGTTPRTGQTASAVRVLARLVRGLLCRGCDGVCIVATLDLVLSEVRIMTQLVGYITGSPNVR